jgi:hypothetical protein
MKEAALAAEKYPDRKETQQFMKDTGIKAVDVLASEANFSMSKVLEETVECTFKACLRYWAASVSHGALEGMSGMLEILLDKQRGFFQPYKKVRDSFIVLAAITCTSYAYAAKHVRVLLRYEQSDDSVLRTAWCSDSPPPANFDVLDE